MSLSEYGGVTPDEMNLLRVAIACGGCARLESGAIAPAEAKALAARLVERGLGELSMHHIDGEIFTVNSAGVAKHREAHRL